MRRSRNHEARRKIRACEVFVAAQECSKKGNDFKLRREKGKIMKSTQTILSIAVLAASFMGSANAASAPGPHQPKGLKPGVIGAIALTRDGSYCHLRFPAIKARTLGTAKPELKAATTSDIVDFYGPCDHDPLGRDEVESQKRAEEERKNEDR
jgi:hypothetical protein